MDELLVFLLKKSAHKRPLRMGSAELGRENNMSQQNASRRLLLLEKEGKITRSRWDGVAITEKGLCEVRQFMQELHGALESGITITGTVVSGREDARRFLTMQEYKERINAAFGFEPFPGTLNIKLSGRERDKRSRMLAMEPVIIEGFEKSGRHYGDLYCYRCSVSGISGAVVFPLKTRHGCDILEIIASESLRKKLGLEDGKEVIITI